MTPLQVKQRLFEIRDITHDLHLNAVSFSQHKALGDFYEKWTLLMDSFLEAFYGKYGRLKGACTININSDINIQNYLVALMVFLNTEVTDVYEMPVDSDFDGIVAEMKQLVNQTMYLLTLN